MTQQTENTAEILALLRRLLNSDVTSRPLFIGHGIFYDGTMFAIYQKRELYLKADGDLIDELLAHGSYPWAYIPRNNMRKGRNIIMCQIKSKTMRHFIRDLLNYPLNRLKTERRL